MRIVFERRLDAESCCSLRITQSDSLIKRFFRILILLPSFLCIDAAFVALGWSQFLALERNGKTLSLSGAFPIPDVTVRDLALFLCVWVIYLFDRLYDSRASSASDIIPLRHQFAKNHFKLLAGLLVGGILLLVLLIPWLETPDWGLGLSVGAGVVFYFTLFRFAENFSGTRKLVSRFPAKETALAIFFTIGVMGAAERLPDLSVAVGETLLLGAAFASLVLSNCLFIAFAERDYDQAFDSSSFFSRFHPSGEKLVLLFPGFTILMALSLGLGLGEGGVALVIGSAAAGLLLVHISPIRLQYRQAFLDAILLLPWIPILIHGYTDR